jgi:hypothetical protein
MSDDNIGIIKWKVNESIDFAVIGIKDRLNRESEQDMTHIEFPVLYKSHDHMIPKFLFTFVDGKVKEIYSYELKRSGQKPIRAMEAGDQDLWYIKINKNDKYLPKKLIDMDSVRRDSIMTALVKLAGTGMLFTELAPLSIVLNRILNSSENKKSYQASYLERLLRLELFEGQMPSLKEAFGELNLWEMGAALNLRFHSESDFAPFFTKKKKMVELYRKYRQLKEESYFETMSKLVQRTNEEGLLTVPLTSEFAIVYAFNNKEYYENFSDFLLNIKNPKDLIEGLKGVELNKDDLVPLGIFSTRESKTAITVVDFNDAGINTKKSDFVKILTDLKDVGFHYLPLSGLSISLRAVDGVVNFISLKTGATVFEHRVYSDAELDLLIDTGIFEISKKNVLKEALDLQLKSIKIDEKERLEILGDLQGPEKEKRDAVMGKVVEKFLNKEKSERIILAEKYCQRTVY